jgi:hypothetical protein
LGMIRSTLWFITFVNSKGWKNRYLK